MPDSTRLRYDAEQLGRRNNAELIRLRYHWDTAYDIHVEYPRSWSARRRDDGRLLTADSAAELRQLIIEDYSRHRVPRRREGGS